MLLILWTSLWKGFFKIEFFAPISYRSNLFLTNSAYSLTIFTMSTITVVDATASAPSTPEKNVVPQECPGAPRRPQHPDQNNRRVGPNPTARTLFRCDDDNSVE